MSFKYHGAKLKAYERSLPQRKQRVEQRTARTAVASIQQRAPVETGELRDSIREEDGRVVATAPHAGFVEFGTYRMAAQPYFIPGMEDARAALSGIAREELTP